MQAEGVIGDKLGSSCATFTSRIYNTSWYSKTVRGMEAIMVMLTTDLTCIFTFLKDF